MYANVDGSGERVLFSRKASFVTYEFLSSYIADHSVFVTIVYSHVLTQFYCSLYIIPDIAELNTKFCFKHVALLRLEWRRDALRLLPSCVKNESDFSHRRSHPHKTFFFRTGT